MKWVGTSVVGVIAVIAAVFVASAACAQTAEEYERESVEILADLPVYPGIGRGSVATERERCEMCFWPRDYYTLASFTTPFADVGGAKDCGAADTIASYYANEAGPEWRVNTDTYPYTWPNGRVGCIKVVTLRRPGALVHVKIGSTEHGGLGRITISISH